MQVQIHYYRPGQGTTIWVEDLVSDDGVRLRTQADLPPDIRQSLSQELWDWGVVPQPNVVHTIEKFYFYSEPFDLLEFHYADGLLAGYYSDVALPLTRVDGAYHMTDLFLDTWLEPGGRVHELDWPEFEAAIRDGLLSEAQQTFARAGMARLLAEIKAGTYPSRYMQ